jgi:exo-beta-1,3-glucanase (GH17 family)
VPGLAAEYIRACSNLVQRLLALFTRPRATARPTRLQLDSLEERLVPSTVLPHDSLRHPAPVHHASAQAALNSDLGFAFSPYVGQLMKNGRPPAFNSYGSGNDSVQNQINLIAPSVSSIATYSAGYAGYYPPSTPWNKVDSNWMVASAAANYNKAHGRLALTVSQGIYQQVDAAHMTAEINGAFQIAANANAIFPHTVQRLIFTNEYVHTAATTDAVDALVRQYSAKAHQMGLQVGVRSDNFGQLGPGGGPPSLVTALKKLVKDVDFIMVNLYPAAETVTKGPAVEAQGVEAAFAGIKKETQALNPKLAVYIGETGWVTQGSIFYDPSGKSSTVANAKAYYDAIKTWANATHNPTYYFEALDESWKAPPEGEAHFGVWTYTTSDANGKFVAKWTA